MTTSIKSSADGLTGELQVNGNPAIRFGVDTSGHLAGFRNKIINGGFAVNQRAYSSGAAVGAGLYGHDRWKMAASGDTYTFSTTNNKTTVTIPAGKVLQQVVEGLNLQTGTYILSWEGTAQGKIGAGSYGASGITSSITGGFNVLIEFGPGTVANVQLEAGSIATPFEHRPYGLELALCQRYHYFQQATGVGIAAIAAGGFGIRFPVSMRAAPTISGGLFNAGTGLAGTFGSTNITQEGFTAYNTAANWTVGAGIIAQFSATSEL